MRSQIQQAVWSSMFQNVEPYLVLRIRRASILNDTIVQVTPKSVHQHNNCAISRILLLYTSTLPPPPKPPPPPPPPQT
jgi:hypothetical protein